MKRYPLRGRSAQMDTIMSMLEQRAAGLAVVRGEPGIGKTALLEEAAAQARRLGYAVGVGAANSGDDVTPIATLGPALLANQHPLVPKDVFLGLAPLNEQPLWLAEHLADLLERRCAVQPVFIALDDAHWMDPMSSFVLKVIRGRLTASPLVLLLATRPSPGGPADFIATGDPTTVQWLDLEPLPDAAVLELAGDRLGAPLDGAAEQLVQEAQGSPFLAVNLADGLIAPDLAGSGTGRVPRRLVDGVAARLATTSAECQSLVRIASILGLRFDIQQVAGLLGVSPPALDRPLSEAIETGLITDDGVTVAFRHELIRLAVYENIPPSIRRATHKTIADNLLQAGQGPAAAVPHVLATPGDQRAVTLLRQAAHELGSTLTVTAVGLIKQAYELVPPQDPQKLEVGREVVEVLVRARQWDQAGVFADDLLRHQLPADDVASIRLSLAPRLWATHDLSRLSVLLDDERTAGASPALAARLTAYRSLWTDMGKELSTTSLGLEDDTAIAITLTASADRAAMAGDYEVALVRYGRARTHARRAGTAVGVPPAGQLQIREMLAAARCDDLDGIDRETPTTDAGGPRASSWESPEFAATMAFLDLGAGRLEESAAAARTALQLMDDVQDHSATLQALHVLISVALLRGDQGQAGDYIGEAERVSGRRDPLLRSMMSSTSTPSVSTVQAAASTTLLWRDELLLEIGCAAFHTDDQMVWGAASAALTDLADRNPGVASAVAAAALLRGLTHGGLVGVMDSLADTPRPLLLARAEEELGRSTLAHGRSRAGAHSLVQAQTRYQELGASAAVDRIEAVLIQTGIRPAGRPTHERPLTGWESLTAAERRVALLVAHGHSNASAATSLVLSPNTISTHLRSVFAKLGVNTRVQLTRQVLTTVNDPNHRSA